MHCLEFADGDLIGTCSECICGTSHHFAASETQRQASLGLHGGAWHHAVCTALDAAKFADQELCKPTTGLNSKRGRADLELSLLDVDALLELTLQDLEKELAVSVPGILPEPKQQVVATLHAAARTGSLLRSLIATISTSWLSCTAAFLHQMYGTMCLKY